MPLLAVLAAAAHIRGSVNDTLFEQSYAQGAKSGRSCDVESTVAVEQCRIIAVELEAFLVRYEHRHARAIFAVVENFLCFVIRGIETWNIDGAIDG